jgi:aryl-alcohol dehydrogenase-like predicted oxidoreductase
MQIPKPYTQTKLGNTNEKISKIGYGAMSLSMTPVPEEEALKVMNEAIDNGCNFFDTSNAYGDNELVIAKVLKQRRNEVFVCTKFGLNRTETGVSVCGKASYVRECCEKSLERLGIDCIDLYYIHRVDPDTPIEETVGAMAELVKEGKVRYLGISECSAETLRKACKVHPISAIQMEYSPWATDIERNGVLEAARENNVTIVAFSPLGKGFLTGAFKSLDDLSEKDSRRMFPRFQGENFKKNYAIVEKITELANQKGVTPGQLCLAWVCAQGDDFVPIPGTKSVKYLHENLAAVSVKLSEQDLKAIREIIDSVSIEGDRFPPVYQKMLNV